MCLGNIWKDLTAYNMRKVDFMNMCMIFSVNYDNIDVYDILAIHKYLRKKHSVKWCLDLLRECLLHY